MEAMRLNKKNNGSVVFLEQNKLLTKVIKLKTFLRIFWNRTGPKMSNSLMNKTKLCGN